MCSVSLLAMQSLFNGHNCDRIVAAEMLHLNRDASNYAYLNKSGCSKLVAVDDKEQFNVTIVSMYVCLLLLVAHIVQ